MLFTRPNFLQVLKLYAWEKSFQQRILEIREEELRVLKKSQYLNAGSAISWFMAPYLVSRFMAVKCQHISILRLSKYDVDRLSLICMKLMYFSMFCLLHIIKMILAYIIFLHFFQVALGSFATYTLSSSQNILDANKAFVSLSLFNIMNFPISMLPGVIAFGVQVW